MPRNSEKLLERLMDAQAMRADGGGFRKLPTSRKNPAFHARKPTTITEKLAREVYGND